MQGFSTVKAVKKITVKDEWQYTVELVCGGKLDVDVVALGEGCCVAADVVKCPDHEDCLWNKNLQTTK